MESLGRRFDVLQDVMLLHYEKGSKRLTDQISYWEAVRRENAILHYARKHRIIRLGYTPVPATATSEAAAKTAIRMTLLLTSLNESPYKDEPWTMSDTSVEMLQVEPQGCFKKRGCTVTVMFDGDPENTFPYTSWGDIYYQNLEDKWIKTEGKVDHDGLYYNDEDGEKIYYQSFAKDALRFGTKKMWKVFYKSAVLSALVSSSGQPAPDWSQDWSGEGGSEAQNTTVSTASTGNRQPASSDSPGSFGPSAGSDHRPGGESRPNNSGGQEAAGGGGGGRGRGRPTGGQKFRAVPFSVWGQGSQKRKREASPDRESVQARGGGGGGQGEPSHPTDRSPSPTDSPRLPRLSTPGSIPRPRGGGCQWTPGNRGPPRLSPALPYKEIRGGCGGYEGQPERPSGSAEEENRPTPVLIFRGDGNAQKCWRRRLRLRHSALYMGVSTGFSWTIPQGPNKVGRHRMLIAFYSEEQRQQFLDAVTVPRGMEYSYGSLDSI